MAGRQVEAPPIRQAQPQLGQTYTAAGTTTPTLSSTTKRTSSMYATDRLSLMTADGPIGLDTSAKSTTTFQRTHTPSRRTTGNKATELGVTQVPRPVGPETA